MHVQIEVVRRRSRPPANDWVFTASAVSRRRPPLEEQESACSFLRVDEAYWH